MDQRDCRRAMTNLFFAAKSTENRTTSKVGVVPNVIVLDTCLILFCSLFIFASVQYLLSTHSTYTFFIRTIYFHFTQLILYSFNNNNILP
jgi:hypothetical protein